MEIVDAVGAGADDAKIGVAHHDGIGRAPFVAGEQAGVDEIDIGLEGRVQAVFPSFERGEDGDVVRRQRVFARPEGVAELAQVNELRHLRFPHDELRAVLDFLVHIRVAEGNGVARIVLPLDDFEELSFEIVNKAHKLSFF